MKQIIKFVIKMLPYMLAVLPITLVIRVKNNFGRKVKGLKTNLYHEIGLIVFILFLIGLASLTIIPKPEYGMNGIGVISNNIKRINLIPFNKLVEIRQNVFIEGNLNFLIIEIMGNLGMFAVIGFMLPLLWTRFETFKNVTFVCFSISFLIETVQLILPRATDVDDLIMNTLGGIIGFLFYMVIKRILPNLARKFKL